jgi:hypothetical protein
MMGRQSGLSGRQLLNDIESGKWMQQTYEVNSRPKPANRNWFYIQEFVELVLQTKRPSAADPDPVFNTLD